MFPCLAISGACRLITVKRKKKEKLVEVFTLRAQNRQAFFESVSLLNHSMVYLKSFRNQLVFHISYIEPENKDAVPTSLHKLHLKT